MPDERDVLFYPEPATEDSQNCLNRLAAVASELGISRLDLGNQAPAFTLLQSSGGAIEGTVFRDPHSPPYVVESVSVTCLGVLLKARRRRQPTEQEALKLDLDTASTHTGASFVCADL